LNTEFYHPCENVIFWISVGCCIDQWIIAMLQDKSGRKKNT
jgi:hypothetical protein